MQNYTIMRKTHVLFISQKKINVYNYAHAHIHVSLYVLYTCIFSQPSIDGWLYAMRMTSVVCNVPVLSQNDSTYHHSVFTT